MPFIPSTAADPALAELRLGGVPRRGRRPASLAPNGVPSRAPRGALGPPRAEAAMSLETLDALLADHASDPQGRGKAHRGAGGIRLEARCPCHLYIGQEAVAAGVCAALLREDSVWGGHRSHGHYLAKGGSLTKVCSPKFWERPQGVREWRGGSMHLLAPEVGILGQLYPS